MHKAELPSVRLVIFVTHHGMLRRPYVSAITVPSLRRHCAVSTGGTALAPHHFL